MSDQTTNGKERERNTHMHININALMFIEELRVHLFCYSEIQGLLPKLFITYGRNRKEWTWRADYIQLQRLFLVVLLVLKHCRTDPWLMQIDTSCWLQRDQKRLHALDSPTLLLFQSQKVFISPSQLNENGFVWFIHSPRSEPWTTRPSYSTWIYMAISVLRN